MEHKRKLVGPILLVVAAVVIVSGFFYYLAASRKLPDGLIAASGRIEGDRIVAAAKYPGRVSKVLMHEGDTVQSGAVVAQLEDEGFQARVEQARQALNGADAQFHAATENLDVARHEVPMGISVAAATLSQAQAVLAKTVAVEAQARLDAQRNEDLFARGVIEKHRSEQADLAFQVASSDVRASQEGVNHAKQALAQANLGDDRINAKKQDVEALRAQRERAAAALTEASSVLSDLVIKAPASGVVLSRLREPGDVVMPGGSIVEMVDLDHLYLKVYVPESRIGQLHMGLAARIYVDSQPDKFYDAQVSYISSRAEFTPKEVQTTDERVKIVYAVKLTIAKNPEHKLTPGIPADAVIRWQDSTGWQKPRWN